MNFKYFLSFVLLTLYLDEIAGNFQIGDKIAICERVEELAVGSTIVAQLTNALVLDVMRLQVPMATGMPLTLCLLSLKKRTPSAKYVLWSRIDQKSCFKSITTAGLTPIIIDTLPMTPAELVGSVATTTVNVIIQQLTDNVQPVCPSYRRSTFVGMYTTHVNNPDPEPDVVEKPIFGFGYSGEGYPTPYYLVFVRETHGNRIYHEEAFQFRLSYNISTYENIVTYRQLGMRNPNASLEKSLNLLNIPLPPNGFEPTIRDIASLRFWSKLTSPRRINFCCSLRINSVAVKEEVMIIWPKTKKLRPTDGYLKTQVFAHA
uniref:O-phosphoseryl-tRNA(Sec) selenium transferase n=1 Tax=Glossina austeni TaxID=7395 RepID=A0A1A9VIF1_GLOAU